MDQQFVKEFLNSPDAAATESLRGTVALNGLVALKKYPHVVVRPDIETYRNKSATLLAGGGSGHEPFAAGYVGSGMLSAAVCGEIFTSPSTKEVHAALEAIKSIRGSVVFVINYTGDRLNFGLAIERFNSRVGDNSAAHLVVIGDDISLEDREQSRNCGCRGIAGAVLVLKIAGTMANIGFTAKEIAVQSQQVEANLGTIGVCLTPCNLPGKQLMFHIPPHLMEVGLGIHGEAGLEQINYCGSQKVVQLLVNKLEKSERLRLAKGQQIAVLLNNLGSCSQLELNVLTGELLEVLEQKQFKVMKFYVGSFMTSINAHGFSISILKLENKDWLTHLGSELLIKPRENISDTIVTTSSSMLTMCDEENVDEVKGDAIDDEHEHRFRRCIDSACRQIIENVTRLNELDSVVGDGDCGTTFLKAAEKIEQALKSNRIMCSFPNLALNQLAKIFEEIGGTTGGLYALMFTAASRSLSGIQPSDWGNALKAACRTLMYYGRAKPSDRSIVDPLYAAAESVTDHMTFEDWKDILKKVEDITEQTRNMVPKCGRASYTTAQPTGPDSGAKALSIWMKAVYDEACT